ncbi:MAG: type II toxin-antitoxin system RelE/ParE family toxin [Clostridia bacterium]|nr:type II toxin-antitoxin system RelE/ParE family toxin [Clostridia bacterium]
MIFKVRIMGPAQNEMREIYRYIAEELHNPIAAVQRISLIDEAIQSLRENPARFPLVRDGYLASKGFRLIVAKNHLVFFIIREEAKAVSVMRVLYGRRDWLRILKVEAENLLPQVDISIPTPYNTPATE